MRLELEMEHEIGAIRLYEPDEHPKSAETIVVEHRLGELKGEVILKFDAQGRLISLTFLYPSKQLLASQIEGAAPRG